MEEGIWRGVGVGVGAKQADVGLNVGLNGGLNGGLNVGLNEPAKARWNVSRGLSTCIHLYIFCHHRRRSWKKKDRRAGWLVASG